MANLLNQKNNAASVYVGNLEEPVTEDLLWELFLQVGPVVSVNIPRDKVSGQQQGYGFVEFKTEEDAEYACKVLNMVKLCGRGIKVQQTSLDLKGADRDIGANLFIGGLHSDIDEQLIYDTFAAFGGIISQPKIVYDEGGAPKGYGFVSFDSFEASDLAISCMNGQFLCNKPLVVQYAFKKDSPGERHGTPAERLIASGRRAATNEVRFQPNLLFSTGEGIDDAGKAATSMAVVGTSSSAAQQWQQQQQQQQQAPPPMMHGALVPPAMPMMMQPPPMPMAMPVPMMGMPMQPGMSMMPPPPPMPVMQSGISMMPPPPPPPP